MPASQCILWIFRSCWIAIKRFNHVPYILYCVTLIIIIEFNYEWDAICELSANNDRLALETVWNLFEGNFLSFEYLNTITDLVRTHLHTHTYFVWLDEVNFWVQITKWFVVRNGLFCFVSHPQRHWSLVGCEPAFSHNDKPTLSFAYQIIWHYSNWNLKKGETGWGKKVKVSNKLTAARTFFSRLMGVKVSFSFIFTLLP